LKVGLSSATLYPANVETTFNVASRLGFDGVEVLITQSSFTRDVARLSGLVDKYGIPILALHAPNVLASSFVWGRNHFRKMFRTVELAHALQVDTIVVHPPYFVQRSHAKWFVDNVNILEAESGLNIAVENMFYWRRKNKLSRIFGPEWETIVDNVDSLTIDFSHAALSGFNILNFTKQHIGKTKHIHVSDATLIPDVPFLEGVKMPVKDEHLPLGDGSQPVGETLRFLKDINWGGNLVCEINLHPYRDNNVAKMRKLKTSLEYIRKNIR
jgi:sugar phosphate isomerase/epimerase